ncbi:MAG: hypothetical protein QMC67_12580 [Candidatus Wallbacteria bacterium]
MKRKFIYLLLIILAVNITVIGSKVPNHAGKNFAVRNLELQKSLTALYSSVNSYMSRFFDESKSMVFYKDIGTFARNHNIQIKSINFSKTDNFDYKIMNFKEIEYDLSASGSYTDIKNFIFRLDNHKYIGSFSYVKLADAAGGQDASGEIAFEAKYKLYSFSGFKKLSDENSGAVSSSGLSNDYTRISFNKSDIDEKSQSKSIFTLTSDEHSNVLNREPKKAAESPAPESASVEVVRNKTLTGYEITINKVAEVSENIQKNDTAEVETAQKKIKGMRYVGYSIGKHNEVKAFIEVNGHVIVTLEGAKLPNGYVVKKIDNNFVKTQNFDEPYDIIELGLEKTR